MSSSREPSTVTLGEGDDGYDALRHDYLQGIFEDIFFTYRLKRDRDLMDEDASKPTVFVGDIEALKTFVREGGDIDKYKLREMIADLIGAKPPKNTGGSKDVVNINYYMDVERHLFVEMTHPHRPAPPHNPYGHNRTATHVTGSLWSGLWWKSRLGNTTQISLSFFTSLIVLEHL